MNHFKHPIFISGIVLSLIAVSAIYAFWGKQTGTTGNRIVVGRASLLEAIPATGRVRAAENVDLAFEKPGKIKNVEVAIGDSVIVGQALVSLDDGDLAAQLTGAEAKRAAEEARLKELKQGTRPEALRLSEAKVAAASQLITDSEHDLLNASQSAYTAADDAVRNKIDQMFSNPRSASPQFNLVISGKSDLELRRFVIESVLTNWQTSLQGSPDPDALAQLSQKNLQQVSDFLNLISLAVNGLTVSSQYPQSAIDALKFNASTARTDVNLAITNLSSIQEKINGAKSNLVVAQSELDLEKSGATEEQIAAESAAVDSTRATVQGIQAELAKTVIRAPFAGTVTRQDGKKGAIAVPNVPLVSLISAAKFQIETAVSEADVAKIKLENEVEITLDAYGNDVFKGEVVSADPAAIFTQGVASYRVVVQFSENDERVKEGMTANMNIITEKRENALAVPASAIIQRGGERFVLVDFGSGSTKETKIETGIRGSNDMVEVVSGLKEGDRIIFFGGSK
ncbi:efflux RND transporter periplasmic adaptor subunit [Patescibacteria group bacterium]|nr:efflux RND transporter periplasmic adaptor subunit [Patescibacteria group bacterium]